MGILNRVQALLASLKRQPLNRFTIDEEDQVDMEVSLNPQVDLTNITDPQLDGVDAEIKFTKRF